MKKICAKVVTGILLLLLGVKAYPQNSSGSIPAVPIEPYRLPITFYKTTHLVFPYPIISVDRGSEDILVQKAMGVENILQVKASKAYFKETNLTVITADGRLYPYIVTYSDHPPSLVIHHVGNPDLARPQAFFSSPAVTEAEVQKNADLIAGKKKMVSGLKDTKYGIQFRVSGIYTRNDVLYFQIKLKNQSNISYDIDQLRFFFRDQQMMERTAYQEREINPYYIKGNPSSIASLSERTFVFALPKFTIPDNKYLAIQLMERDGGRHLELQVPNRAVIRAKLIPPQ